jgi:cyclase
MKTKLGLLALWMVAALGAQEIRTLKVQGNVYLLSGAGGNVVVQVGDEGVVVVDTGTAGRTDALIAAIRKLSDKPLQWIINTNMHPDFIGGNDAMRKAGVTITGANVAGNLTDAGEGAQIIAHENLLNRVSAPTGKQAAYPFGYWPTATYVTGQKELFFNDEPIEAKWMKNASTDGDSIVFFRRSDVVVAGDVMSTTSYPFIDVANGGTVDGLIEALNVIIDLAIPKHQEEGGTYVVPGHGRICDEFDVVEYRDMATIVRDRVKAGMKKSMTLAQIQRAGYTKDYDLRYNVAGTKVTADAFIESIYKSLGGK